MCLLPSCCGGGSSLRPPGRHQGSNPRLQDVDGGLQISAEAPTAAVRRSWRCSVPGRNEIVYPCPNEEKLHSRHAVGCPAPSTATGPWCSLRADWMAAPHPGTGQRRRSSTETCDVPLRRRITSTLTPLLPLQPSNPAGIQRENKSKKPEAFEPTSGEVIAPLSPVLTCSGPAG